MEQKYKLLVIEDNNEMRENIAEILELSGYEVSTAADGLQGVQAARQHKPDLILCDIMMPNLDGFGVLKILQQDSQLKSTPFVFLTAKAEKDDFRKGMNLGAEDYLLKPFEDSDLLQVIETKLEKYRELSRNRSSKILSGLIDFNTLEKFPAVHELLAQSESREFGKKSKLWHTNDKVNQIYFVESGTLKEGQETVGGKEFIFQFYHGPVFAGISHLFQLSYHSHCEVIETAIIKTVSKKAIEEIILKENLWTSFQHYFSQLCQDHLSRLAINSFGNVREKVAFHLFYLHKRSNHKVLQLSREDLASFCGIAKETLIRCLAELKEEKLLEISTHGIHLLHPTKLEALFM